ncbi:hypothetical protein GGR50DRAFT_693124 [Xylaria sp. CBS 124048]|nr:hypothetical protein GGR50DRAFT_693124 [Xylaria sp. CBS 124048]
MSGVEEPVTRGQNGPATSQAEPARRDGETLKKDRSAPRTMPDMNLNGMDGHDEEESEPAAGRINDRGEVIDDDGQPVGKVTGGEPGKFAGYIVTQEGDILDDDGNTVGTAEPLEDKESALNYTTRPDEESEKSRGDEAKGAKDTMDKAGEDAKNTAEGAAGNAIGTQDGTGAAMDTAKDTAEGAKDTAGGAVDDTAKDTAGKAGDTTEDIKDTGEKTAEGAKDAAKDVTGAQEDTGAMGDTAKDTAGKAGDTAEQAKDTAEGATGEVKGAKLGAQRMDESVSALNLASKAQNISEEGAAHTGLPPLSASIANKVVAMYEGPFTIKDDGKVTDQAGEVLGKLSSDSDIQDLVGKDVKGIDEEGNLLGQEDAVLGKLEIAPEGPMADRVKEEIPEAASRINALEGAGKEAAPVEIPSFPPDIAEKVIGMFEGPFTIAENGRVTDSKDNILGKLAEGIDPKDLAGKDIKSVDQHGNLLGDDEANLGRVDIAPDGDIAERIKKEIPEASEHLDAIEGMKKQAEIPDLSILEGLNINKAGNILDENGKPLGKVKSGDLEKLVGKAPDKDGKVHDDEGNVIGEVEILPEDIDKEHSPFEEFPGATVDKSGKVIFEERQVGAVVGDDWEELIEKKVNPEGDILDEDGNVIGHAERTDEADEEPLDYSILRDKKVNKIGNIVDENGVVFGHIIEGNPKALNGKKVADNGQIFDDAGQVIGKAEPIPDSEREDLKEHPPFEEFPNATVGDNGDIIFEGEKVGIVIEGDAKKLKGKTVDPDGDILDKSGNTLGRAERWEAESEPEVDMSPLIGKKINKAGNAVDENGDIYGRVIEGRLKSLIGKTCDKNGCIRDDSGDIIGKCEIISEAERESMREKPFSELSGCTVNKEGKIVTPGGDVVGRLVEGDGKTLAGRPVDEDGDICDKNGNALGHAERWEEPEPEKEISPMSGRKVNREGNVVNEDGDVIGKLTTGELSQCTGKKIDDDGDVVDQKGNTLGHCSLLEEIPEPTETEEERNERLKKEEDNEIAKKIATCIEQSIDKVKPICKMITERIDQEEAKSEEDRDEDALINAVRPLIEEGGKILTEANGVIRGLDPDGRISAQAKHHAAGHEATPEEYQLAELLKELSGTVTETIEGAKRKLENLPKAKKALNPLWGLLSNPLAQIVAAVGLLLSGVLGLVGNLLGGLGLGNLLGNVIGGLGVSKALEGLGGLL